MSYIMPPVPHITVLDLATQTIAAINTAQVVTFSTVGEARGISLVSSSRITLPVPGVYQFAFSAVAQASTSNKFLSIWFRKNGSDVANSNTRIVCLNGEPTIMAAVINLSCTTAGDYYQLWMGGTATSAGVYTTAATAGPPAEPAVPSIIVTAMQVS